MASRPFPDKKRRIWVMKYRPDPTGKWVRVTLGKDPRLEGARPPKSPPQAVLDRAREFAEIEYRAKHGMQAGPARARGLAAYLEDYVTAFAASHKPGSVRQLARHVENFAAFAKGKGVTSVQGVSRSVCRDFLEYRISLVSHDTLRTEAGYLMPVWSRAVEDGLVGKNPWARLKVPGKSTRSDPTFWTAKDVARIAAHCARPWQSDFVLLLANTGMRISTALAMKWGWVNWAEGSITIPREAAATQPGVKTGYTMAMNRVARDVLQKRRMTKDSPDLVFPNPYHGGGEIPYDSAREAIARAIKNAGVKKGTPHDLRHTYGRLLMKSGVPANVVQAQLGHSSLATTQRYVEIDAAEAARQLENFGIGDAAGSDSEGG